MIEHGLCYLFCQDRRNRLSDLSGDFDIRPDKHK